MNFVIFDTEYTTWEGCIAKGWHGFQKKEIVQIAAIKVELDTLKVIDSFNCLVKPKINSVLSDYFINLTGITNEQLRYEGRDFAVVYDEFEQFCCGDPCLCHSWGGGNITGTDGDILQENIKINNLNKNCGLRFCNIADWFADRYKEKNIRVDKQSSGQIASILGVEKDLEQLGLSQHNAFYDVYSILSGIKFLGSEGLAKLWL